MIAVITNTAAFTAVWPETDGVYEVWAILKTGLLDEIN